MTAYSFLTEPFRYAEKVDQTVRNTYPLARVVQVDGCLTNLTDADAVAQTLFDILKAPRQRFDVPVLGVNVVNLSMFDGQAPCATLIWNRFDLTLGKLVIIPDFSIEPGPGTTILRCWG